MMKYYIADAFTSQLFTGNPAGICMLDTWPDDTVLQNIAFENNLSETAFLVKKESEYELRWFTPECEIDLCGHATLASAFVLFKYYESQSELVNFHTKSGILSVFKNGDTLKMNFPSRKPIPTAVPAHLEKALGIKIAETFSSRDLVVVAENEFTVKNLTPDFNLLKHFNEFFGIIVTAKGDSCDFVSRYFAPGAGIMEDPVTGSAHSTLIPFWSERLHKEEMTASSCQKEAERYIAKIAETGWKSAAKQFSICPGK